MIETLGYSYPVVDRTALEMNNTNPVKPIMEVGVAPAMITQVTTERANPFDDDPSKYLPPPKPPVIVETPPQEVVVNKVIKPIRNRHLSLDSVDSLVSNLTIDLPPPPPTIMATNENADRPMARMHHRTQSDTGAHAGWHQQLQAPPFTGAPMRQLPEGVSHASPFSQVWSGGFEASGDSGAHPLKQGNNESAKPVWDAFDPLNNPSPKRSNASHKVNKTMCTSDLRAIAQALSADKPRALNEAEQAMEAQQNHVITLGLKPKQSTGSKKTHARNLSGKFEHKVKKMVIPSTSINKHKSELVDKINESGNGLRTEKEAGRSSVLKQTKKLFRHKTGSEKARDGIAGITRSRSASEKSISGTPTTSPITSPMGSLRTLIHNRSTSPILGGSLRNLATLKKARNVITNSQPSSPRLSMVDANNRGSSPTPLDVDNLVPPPPLTGASPIEAQPKIIPGAPELDLTHSQSKQVTPKQQPSTPVESTVLRSSEQDPSAHQIEIPSAEEFLMHLRACHFLDTYRIVDQNYDLTELIGMGRLQLEALADSPNSATQHKPILKSLLQICSDVFVEGFFVSSPPDGDSNDPDHRMEAIVLSSQKFRQFMVIYRGTNDLQIKPIRNREQTGGSERYVSAQQTLVAPDMAPVSIFPPFRDKYFSGNLETQVFRKLEELSERHLFCDVVTIGHSFGAVLATLGAVRFASAHPMIRVSCHAFGSPKVGAQDLKQMANSLPNLKMMRVEYAGDPWVHAPDTGTWAHMGHSLVVTTDNTCTVRAYRFDKGRASRGGGSMPAFHKKHKRVSELRKYIHAMEQFTSLGLPWVTNGFEGENIGKGVTRGTENEKRLVV